MRKKAVIFDLDGVLASTDEHHYRAWKDMADREGIPFDRTVNRELRGVSRMASLEIILRRSPRRYGAEEKEALAAYKNARYRELLEGLTPADVLPGAAEILARLRAAGVKTAVGSSSRNARLILEKTGLARAVDAVADGTEISRSKPDPEVFLLAARKLEAQPSECAVVEDAEAGIDAALAAGMKAVGVGQASGCARAQVRLPDLASVPDLSVLLD